MESSCMDCNKFLELVQLIIDGEATQEQKELFHKHYCQCNHCAEHYQLEASTIAFIKQKLCGCRQAPPTGFAEQIRALLPKA